MTILTYFQGVSRIDYTTYGIDNIISIDIENCNAFLGLNPDIFMVLSENLTGVTIYPPYLGNQNYLSSTKFLSIDTDINHNGSYYLSNELGGDTYFPHIGSDDTKLMFKFITIGSNKGKNIFKLEIYSNNILDDLLLHRIYDESIDEKDRYPTIISFSYSQIDIGIFNHQYSSTGKLYENITECDGVSSYVTQLSSILRLMNGQTTIKQGDYHR